MKLVKIDLEKMKNAKEFEKEYVFALTEHDFNSLNFPSKFFALVNLLKYMEILLLLFKVNTNIHRF